MIQRIYLSPPDLTGEEIQYVQDALASNWVAPVGPHVDAFEDELSQKLDVEGCVAVNSGTSAIHLGLLALGVQPGDEVICPTLTFCATVNPVVYCGASPIFIDSELDTWNMDPELLEEAIRDRLKKFGRKPKAIIVVHLYGMPALMDEILSISQRYEIPILEDAAEALGSYYRGKAVGTLGEVGVLSFNGNKIITTSAGGAVLSKHPQILDKCRYLRQEAKEQLPYFEHKQVGYNYRLSNVSAAIGRAQLKVLENRVTKRRENYAFYRQMLSNIKEIQFQQELSYVHSNRWLTTILLQPNCSNITNDSVRLLLEKCDIESRLAWKPMHMQPVFRSFPFYRGHNAESLFNRGLCLPSGSSLTEVQIDYVTETVKRLFPPVN